MEQNSRYLHDYETTSMIGNGDDPNKATSFLIYHNKKHFKSDDDFEMYKKGVLNFHNDALKGARAMNKILQTVDKSLFRQHCRKLHPTLSTTEKKDLILSLYTLYIYVDYLKHQYDDFDLETYNEHVYIEYSKFIKVMADLSSNVDPFIFELLGVESANNDILLKKCEIYERIVKKKANDEINKYLD